MLYNIKYSEQQTPVLAYLRQRSWPDKTYIYSDLGIHPWISRDKITL